MRPSRTRRSRPNFLLTLLLSLSFLLTSFLPPFQSTALAWKPKTHLYLAREAILDALDNGKVTIYKVDHRNARILTDPNTGGPAVLGEYAVDPATIQAIRYSPQYFAGVIGPDAYPDILTGQQAIHPDNRPGATTSAAWLSHLNRAYERYGGQPWVNAFVLGNYTHAAGDMFAHTFVNNYSGGEFSLGYNAVKHIVLESYIEKRTPDITNVRFSIEGLEDFIYRAMVDVRPDQNPLTPPLAGDGSEYSIPAMFSSLRRRIESSVRHYHKRVQVHDDRISHRTKKYNECNDYLCQLDWARLIKQAEGERALLTNTEGLWFAYYEAWIDDIESGLRAWPVYNHRIALAVAYNPNGADIARATDIAEDYVYDHLISMAGAPDFVGLTAKEIDNLTDKMLAVVPDLQRQLSQLKRDLYFYLIKEMTGVDAEAEYRAWKGYLTSPEIYFDSVMAMGYGEPITLQQLNRDLLRIDDPGYSMPNARFEWTEFAPAYNTVTMTKILLMTPMEVRRMMKDLGSSLADQEDLWTEWRSDAPVISGQVTIQRESATVRSMVAGGVNAMDLFMATMDGDNQWCANPNKMVVARDPAAYTQIFMHQPGQRLVGECPNHLDPASFGSSGSGAGSGASTTGISANVDTGGSDGLRVRSAPDPQATIIGRLANGTAISPVARSADGQWLRIVWPAAAGGYGWVRHEWVRLSVPISSLPVWNPASGGQTGSGSGPGSGQTTLPAPTGTLALPIFDGARGTYDVWLVNADGSNLRKVVSEASAPALSADGQRLAYRRWKRDDRGIVVAGRDGSNPLRVTANLEDVLPSFSPDGKRILFSSYREGDRRSRIYYVWSDEANYKAWEWSGGGLYGEDPAWAADGGVVYVGTRPVRELRAMQDGGGNQRAIMAPDTAVRSPAVSPDGSKIAYMTSVNGNFEIYVANRDGSSPVRLTQDAAEDGLPVWSPSGQHIAFVSKRGGAWALWVMEASGANARQVVALPGSVDGRVRNEMEYLTKGWLEEQIAWSQ